ncbi:MAG: tRNA lysidine(34) synthetase TilS [Actinobacteria bacterium]|nr:tRNA lysidine(34) synthetase TilS [Actinomycetota bacterium]
MDAGALLPRCAFPPAGSAVTCAVSGGADSLALLVLGVTAGLDVTAVHVDHGLRAGSAAEADVVAGAAARFGVGFRSVRVRVAPGPNLEARARAARYDALPADVLTGHTLDDRAETVLLNLLRGAGLDGMSALRPDARHPIAGLRRAETRSLCVALGLRPVEDPSNRDPAHLRNRVRHEVLPLLDEVAGRDVALVLARQADLLGDDADLLAGLAAAVDPTDAAGLAEAPRALARRAVRAWLRSRPGGQPPAAATVERVLAVARGEATGTDVGAGWSVRRRRQRLRLEPPGHLCAGERPGEDAGP